MINNKILEPDSIKPSALERNKSREDFIKDKILVSLPQNLIDNLQKKTDVFWQTLDSMKIELYECKLEIEKLNNEASNRIQNRSNYLSKFEKVDLNKKTKDEINFSHNKSTTIIKKDSNKKFQRTSASKFSLKLENKTSLKNNTNNSDSKFIEFDFKLVSSKGNSVTPSDGKIKLSNSHSPPKKSKLAIKIDNPNTSLVPSAKSKKSEKPSVPNIHPIKIENSPYLKKKVVKTYSNIKNFSPAITNTTPSKFPSSTKSKSSMSATKKFEDPKQIEINLTDDVNADDIVNFNYLSNDSHVNNEKNIYISNNEEANEDEQLNQEGHPDPNELDKVNFNIIA